MRRIWLITDFQEGSPYIFQMRCVIYAINPEASVIDITHSVPPHNIEVGAFLLKTAVRYVPLGDIIVGVIDPGVGSGRRALIVSTEKHVLVGPDNGLFSLVGKIKTVYEINVKKLKEIFGKISTTFHGRDVFAPTAALISLGIKLNELGVLIKPKEIISLHDKLPEINGNVIKARVIYIDPFGNIILNVSSDSITNVMQYGRIFRVKMGDTIVKVPLMETYGRVKKDAPLLVINSFDLLELAINQGNAARRYNVEIGDEIVIFL